MMARERAREAAAIAALIALKCSAMLYARHCGFAQISDDDYARTVIAQSFAHMPNLDPSGTSWLPFPFWLYGTVMMLVGRALATARALAFALGALSPIIPYVGLRTMQYTRIVSSAGAALGALTAWNVWLALAPVPEGWAGLCAASALFLVAAGTPRGAIAAGALAFVASLSRYETWPVAALVAGVCAFRAVRGIRDVDGASGAHDDRSVERRARLAFATGGVLALAGPVAWLVNNALTHGDAFHFIARVAAYRRLNAGTIPMSERILEYPRALFHDARELVVVGAIGAYGIARRADLRARWVLPIAGAILVFAFLVYGDVRDGAPTHHAARALVPVFGVLGGVGAVGIGAIARDSRRARAAAFAGALVWVVYIALRVRGVPGAGDDERRESQIARGLALSSASALEVTPCAYEHFALIAAYAAPERVTIAPSTHEHVTPECPRVTSR